MLSRNADIVRVALALLAVLSAIFLTWWLPPIFMTLLALRWRAWEVPLIGLFVDFLWLPQTGLAHLPLMTLYGMLVVWLLEPLRERFLLS